MAEVESGKAELPEKEQIASLPRWAQAAFAARCARRVQPLFRRFRRSASVLHVETLDEAIALAETCASSARIIAHRQCARHLAESTRDAGLEGLPPDAADKDEAASAAFVVAAAVEAATAYTDETVARAVHLVFKELHALVRTIPALIGPIRRDAAVLVRTALSENWTNATPVSPDFFGPLWPDDEPAGWLAEKEKPRHDEQHVEMIVEVPPRRQDIKLS